MDFLDATSNIDSNAYSEGILLGKEDARNESLNKSINESNSYKIGYHKGIEIMFELAYIQSICENIVSSNNNIKDNNNRKCLRALEIIQLIKNFPINPMIIIASCKNHYHHHHHHRNNELNSNVSKKIKNVNNFDWISKMNNIRISFRSLGSNIMMITNLNNINKKSSIIDW
jgi:hypothetical protein